jgi:hypothetical protein
MTVITKLAVSCLVAAGTVLAVQHGVNALHPTLPKDMPGNAQFLQSGYDVARNEPKGEWIACRPDAAQDANFCRVTDAHGMVIYQGDFLPIYSRGPVQEANLKVSTSEQEKNLWIDGPTSDGPVPVIPLADGDVLVPVADQPALAARWNRNPDGLARLQGE